MGEPTESELKIANLKQASSIVWRAEGYLRLGQVIYSGRQMGHAQSLFTENDGDMSARCRRILSRLRKGEQMDAQDEMKSLLDRINNEIRKLEQPKTDQPA